MATPYPPFTVPSPNDIRDGGLRVMRNGLIQRGITSPELGPGSDEYIRWQAFANELAVAHANQVVMGDNFMPDTATGDSLVRWGAIVGLSKRSAGGSSGNIVANTTISSYVAAGSQLTASDGLRFQVATGGTYTNGASIPLIAIDAGAATNHAAGDTLRWVSAPPGHASTAIVATGGLTGGVEAEDEETFRARLLSYFQNPGVANWNWYSTIALQASNSVAGAAVYPAFRGPSTVDVCVWGYQSKNAQGLITSATRDISSTVLTNTITPFIQGLSFEGVDVSVTTVGNLLVDVAIGLTLPSAPTASPPGPGGGWLDGAPWPPIQSGNLPAHITAKTSSTSFTVDAVTTPAVGYHVAYIDKTTWTYYQATITNVTGSSGAWVLTIDTPFPNIDTSGTGDYLFPACSNGAQYLTNLLAAFGAMGPGEKTSNTAILTRGTRKPPPSTAYPYSLTGTQLRYITNGTTTLPACTEVTDAQWYYRSASTPTVATTPYIFVPDRIGFYPY